MTNASAHLLLWRREEPWPGQSPSESWSALQPVPKENRGFFEKQRYVIEKPFPGAAFYIDDEPLPDDAENQQWWFWTPGFFAGEVTAELTNSDGAVISVYLLDVAPDPRKAGRDVFAEMVREVRDEDPALIIGEEPAVAQIGEMGTIEDPWLAFARLRRYGHETMRALDAIRAFPRRSLRVRREMMPLQAVRRVDQQTARALRHTPHLSAGLFRFGNAAHQEETRLDVPQIEETLDSAANRAVLALQRALLRRTQAVEDCLAHLVANERSSETRTPLTARWPRRRAFLDNLASQLKHSIRRPPWSDVMRAEVSAAGLTAISGDPLYSRAWTLGWRALRSGAEEDVSQERLWITPSWEVYERWCFVRIARLLRNNMPDWDWRRTEKAWVGSKGECRVHLELQPTFRAGPSTLGGRWSLSKQREPDLLLTAERSGATHFLLLDAKYRTSREGVLDGMASAHIYRDSLRMAEERADAALLLIPAGGSADWLERPQFHRAHQVGVHVLAPGEDMFLPCIVGDFLTRWAHY